MKPADLCKASSAWFGQGRGLFSDVVISSRIRLARNAAGFAFVPCLGTEQKQQVLDTFKTALLALELEGEIFFIDVAQASPVERELLAERHLITRRQATGQGPRGVIVAYGEAFAAMINEEDHLRMQVLAPGLDLHSCWERINHIDDKIEQQVRYAFDQRYGYMTACPTNLGTGIRVSVMLHLPALKMTGQIEKVLAAARDCDLAVRGLFGEGTEAIGDLFQLSNQVTLGVSEAQVVEDFVSRIVPKIAAYELEARKALLAERPQTLDDKIQRALGVLRNACLVSSQEALFLLSNVRLGVNLGRIEKLDLATVNELFMLTQPAHLQLRAGRMLDAEQRDSLRAQILRSRLCIN